MLELVSIIRPYLEVAYFLSGIFILLGLFFAYRQLNLLRLDVDLRNDRAAKESAIRACERYLNSYTKRAKLLLDEREAKSLPDYTGPIGDFSSTSIPNEFKQSGSQKLLLENLLSALNELEAIATSFRTGVADEKTGFEIIGRTFCSTVEHHYDVIALCRNDKVHGYWSGIVDVYSIWRPRLNKAEMEFAKNLLAQEIDRLKDSEIPPLGRDRT